MDWIDVNDRLPELHDEVWDSDGEIFHYDVSDPVLVAFNNGEQTVACYEVDKDVDFRGWVNVFGSEELHSVTHWMPLPALPGEKDFKKVEHG